MRSFWFDPYFWVHLAGAAVVPLALELCLLGLAAGNPFLPLGLEFLLIGSLGAAPILWMQWQRPFSIYSLIFLAVKPTELTEPQRKALRRFKSPVGKGLSLITAAVLWLVLWQLYRLAPLASESASIVPWGHVGGFLLATIAFLGSNLFLQVPVSVIQVMLASEAAFAATEPYPVQAVAQDFTLFGIRVKQILPPLVAEPEKPKPAKSSQPASGKTVLPEPPITAPIAVKPDSNPSTATKEPDEIDETEVTPVAIDPAAIPESASIILNETETPDTELLQEPDGLNSDGLNSDDLSEDWGDADEEAPIASVSSGESGFIEVIEAEVVETFDTAGEVENIQVEVTIVAVEPDAPSPESLTEPDESADQIASEAFEEPIVAEDVSEDGAIELEQLDNSETAPTVNLEDVSEDGAIDVNVTNVTDVPAVEVPAVEMPAVEMPEVQITAVEVTEVADVTDVVADEETSNWDDDDESWDT
ncbi:MAG TPA: low-complexity tail membrane protein [Trichocoleus sp.]|jgi:hypothetical protein